MDAMERLEAALGPERMARLRQGLEELRPHYERVRAFARELPPRDWAGLAVAAAAFLFMMQFSRLMTRQTRLMERQTALLESQAEAAQADRDARLAVGRARLRGALWRIDEVLKPAALKDVAALPDRRGGPVHEARQVLEEEELNPALLADSDAAAAWERALAAARLAEETASEADADAQFFLMQADRVRSEVMSVREKVAPESIEPGAPSVPFAPPAAASPAPLPPAPLPPAPPALPASAASARPATVPPPPGR